MQEKITVQQRIREHKEDAVSQKEQEELNQDQTAIKRLRLQIHHGCMKEREISMEKQSSIELLFASKHVDMNLHST